MKDKTKKYGAYLLFLFMVVIVLILNFKTPLMGEDMVLRVFNINGPQKNVIFSSLVSRIYHQSILWNARIGEQISIIFSLFDKTIFNVFNTIYIYISILLIFFYAFKRVVGSSRDIIFVFCIFSMIFLFQPCLGEIFFWRTGSTNYLWGLCILLLFSIPLLFMYYHNKDVLENRRLIVKIIYVLMGVFAGLTNENTVICCLLIYIALFVKQKKRPIYIYLSCLTTFLSYSFLLFGPSTRIRRETYLNMYGVNIYRDNLIRILWLFFRSHIWYVVFVLIFSICILLLRNTISSDILLNLKRNVIMLLTSLVSLIPLIVVPYTEERSFLLIDFFICVVLITEIEIIFTKIKNSILVWVLFGIVCILTLCQNINMITIYNGYYEFVFHRNMNIISHKQKKEKYIWEEYPDKSYLKNRILTTREDYAVNHLDEYIGYFDCEIER